jgi:hypothetical protein
VLPADIGRLVTTADPKVSPDGRTVAFVVTRVDLGEEPLPQRRLARGGRRVLAAPPAHGG